MANNIESQKTEINPEELAKNGIQKQIKDQITNHYNKIFKDGSLTLEEYIESSMEKIKSDVGLEFLFNDKRPFSLFPNLGAKERKDIEKLLQSKKN